MIIKSVESRSQSQLPAFKQSLMITAESAIFNQYHYNNQENDSFWVKNHYYYVIENWIQTFQQLYSYKLTAYHDATN